MGKGNQLAGEEKMKLPSFRIHESKLDAFDDYIDQHPDWSSRSESVRALIEKEMESADIGEPDEHLPSNPHDRRIYEALLTAANEKLIYNPQRHERRLKQELSDGNLEDAYVPLRRNGFLARKEAPPGSKGGTVYHVKPRGADPDLWTKREIAVTGAKCSSCGRPLADETAHHVGGIPYCSREKCKREAHEKAVATDGGLK
jgi:hypothetical protein